MRAAIMSPAVNKGVRIRVVVGILAAVLVVYFWLLGRTALMR